MHHDERGHPMTTDSGAAAAALDRAIHNFVHWRAEVIPPLTAALEADPGCGLALAVNGLVLHAARNAGLRPRIEALLAAARQALAALSERERLYVRALEAAVGGRLTESVVCYETILAHHPTDLLAQRLSQMELFWMGEMGWSAAISARVAGHWRPAVPGYGDHLACRAFDLEETQRFAEAERLGREAVAIDATDVWGTHAVAHVLFMQARHLEGIAWLDGLQDHWGEANQMVFHLWWHRCLFHLERAELDAALDIYDRWVRNRAHPLVQAMPDLYIDLQNGASLLLRLERRGVDVGHRWDELAEHALERLDDHTSPFTSAHFAIILAATERWSAAERLIGSMRAFATEPDGSLPARYAAAAIPAAEAAVAHRRGQWQQVVERLMPARRMLWQMGGSHAQRDLFFLLLADALQQLGRGDLLAIVLDDIGAAGFAEATSRIGEPPRTAAV